MKTLLLLFSLVLVACASGSAQTRLSEIVTPAELHMEIATKQARVHAFLEKKGYTGVLLTRVDNFSWITGGLADNHIVITSEIGAASLLILRDGSKYLVGSNSEVSRLQREDLMGLDYTAKEFRWYEEKVDPDRRKKILHDLVGSGPLASDTPEPGMEDVSRAFAELRYELTPSEIKKYRWIGCETSEAVAEVAKSLRPGVTERQMEAAASAALMRRGLRPTVLLMGADHRVVDFYHHTPTDLQAHRYAIVNVCARRWGLVASVARFVHFGPLDTELRKKLQAAATLTAEFMLHTRPGVTGGEMISMAQHWYANAGFPDDWQRHHQGGAIGYAEREWIAVPGSTETIHDHQAFAWNPIVRGALSFDTVLVNGDHIENLTAIAGWPTFSTTVEGQTFAMPDILIAAPARD